MNSRVCFKCKEGTVSFHGGVNFHCDCCRLPIKQYIHEDGSFTKGFDRSFKYRCNDCEGVIVAVNGNELSCDCGVPLPAEEPKTPPPAPRPIAPPPLHPGILKRQERDMKLVQLLRIKYEDSNGDLAKLKEMIKKSNVLCEFTENNPAKMKMWLSRVAWQKGFGDSIVDEIAFRAALLR